MNTRSFGRRAAPQQVPRPGKVAPIAHPRADDFPVIRPETDLPPPDADALSVDDELREWTKARRQKFQLPWRQIYLMAGLCFGIASTALPDTINAIAQWPLYALAAASLFAGFRRKAQKH